MCRARLGTLFQKRRGFDEVRKHCLCRYYSLWRWGVTFHVLDVSHETPDVTPCRTSLPMPFCVHVSRETPDVTPCDTSPQQGTRPMFVPLPWDVSSPPRNLVSKKMRFLRGKHLSNTTSLTQVFCKSGKEFDKLWWSLTRWRAHKTNEAASDEWR